MKTAVYTESSQIVTREAPSPSLGAGDVLLRVKACGVCGTDVRKVRHGLAKPPVVLGHEVAGDVAITGPDVTRFAKGDRVVVAHHTPCYNCHYCRHGNHSMCRLFKSSNLDPGGFAEFVRIPAGHVEMTAHLIPPEMTYGQAIYMEPLACVVRNLKRTKILPGDTALIIGLGSMGLLTGQLIRQMAAQVLATDLHESRVAIARDLGFEAALRAGETDLGEVVRSLTDGRGVDLLILTAGNAQVYSDSVRYVRDGGTISIFAGLEPGAQVSFEANELYSRELTIYASYSPSPAELAEALEHLRTGTVNVDALRAKHFPLGELRQAIDEVATQKVLKAIIRPDGISA